MRRPSVLSWVIPLAVAVAPIACADGTAPHVEPMVDAYSATLVFNGGLHSVFTSFIPTRPLANLNDRGQVVFTARDKIAYLWDRGSLIRLGPGEAWDINERGEIAGSVAGAAVVWDSSLAVREVYRAPHDPNALRQAASVAINDSGVVAVWWKNLYSCGPGGRCTTGLLRMVGGVTSLLTRESVYPTAMNSRGWITGYNNARDHHDHPFVIRDSILVDLEWDGSYQYAWDINTRGDVVGSGVGGSGFDGQYWPAEGEVRKLPGGSGNYVSGTIGINDAGEIVGVTTIAPVSPTSRRAARWRNGELALLDDLVDSRWTLTLAVDVNERGQILAVGVDQQNGGEVLVLLDPHRYSRPRSAQRQP